MKVFDVKIYDDKGKEKETLRLLSEAQMITLTQALKRLKVVHKVSEYRIGR